MAALTKSLTYPAVVVCLLASISLQVYAAPKDNNRALKKEMHHLLNKYKDVGHIDAVNKGARTIVINGKTYSLAAGMTIIGYGKKNKYNTSIIKPGMNAGYKLKSKSSDTIDELWIIPE